jgi:heme exporter protein D
MANYLEMGGYALYVWPAWGLAGVILVGMLGVSLARRQGLRQRLARLEADHDSSEKVSAG